MVYFLVSGLSWIVSSDNIPLVGKQVEIPRPYVVWNSKVMLIRPDLKPNHPHWVQYMLRVKFQVSGDPVPLKLYIQGIHQWYSSGIQITYLL